MPEPELRERLRRALGPAFEVRRLLCRGARADVYEVWDTGLGRRIALKVLRPDVVWPPDMLARFREDTALIARVNHPNVLPIHFVGEAEGLVYYARPYVEGQSLESLLRASGPLDIDRAMALAAPLLQALQYAHERGLIHRGIKPANIFVDRDTGRPVLADFGVAKLADCAPARGDLVAATSAAHYEAPEQARGLAALDARTDVYAMGAVILQMVTGAMPFGIELPDSAENPTAGSSNPVRAPADRLPKWLVDVLLRAVARDPDERYQSAGALLDALTAGQRSGNTESVSAAPIVRRLVSEEPIVLMPGGSIPAGEPTARGPVLPRPDRRPRSSGGNERWAVLLAVLLAVGAAFVYESRPTLIVTNRLALPIRVAVPRGGPQQLLAPGATLTVRLPRTPERRIAWSAVRPVRTDGTPLGAELRGDTVVTVRWGRINLSARARDEQNDYFAPLITNVTGVPLRVTVNASLKGAIDCRCTIDAGKVRANIGYYPLFQNSTVRATDSAGRKATFADLGRAAQAGRGIVRLRFEAKDLATP